MLADLSSILYDHYKDTCSIIGVAIKRRDRAMLYTIVAAGFFALQGLFPSVANEAVTEYLGFKFGLVLHIDFSILGNIVWLAIVLFALRYLQTAVFVERQYAYLQHLEIKLNEILGQEVITREGKSYLAQYPWFSDLMWVLYTMVLPALLLLVTFAKIASEWLHVGGEKFSFSLFFDSFVFFLLALGIGLYLGMLHFRKNKTTAK